MLIIPTPIWGFGTWLRIVKKNCLELTQDLLVQNTRFPQNGHKRKVSECFWWGVSYDSESIEGSLTFWTVLSRCDAKPAHCATVNPIKLEAGLRPNSAGIPHTLLLRIEATGFPTFGLSLYGLGLYGILKRSIRVPRRLPFMDPWRNPSRLPFILVAETV